LPTRPCPATTVRYNSSASAFFLRIALAEARYDETNRY
jgi:hypothetical protein